MGPLSAQSQRKLRSLRQLSKHPLLKSFAQIGLAGLLGSLSYFQSRVGAVEEWEKAHSPPASIVHQILSFHGYRQLDDGPKLHRVSRTLPAQLDPERTIWLHRSLPWVLYFSAEDSILPYQIFCRGSEVLLPRLPEDWQLLGKGWLAVEELAKKIERGLPKDPPQTSAKGPSAPKLRNKPLSDRRAIIF